MDIPIKTAVRGLKLFLIVIGSELVRTTNVEWKSLRSSVGRALGYMGSAGFIGFLLRSSCGACRNRTRQWRGPGAPAVWHAV